MKRAPLMLAGVAALLSVAHGGSVHAETVGGLANTTPEQRADFQTEQMKKLVGLAPAQVPAVAALNLEYAKLLDPVLKGSGSSFHRMQEGRDILARKDEAMKNLLPTDQYTRYLDTKDQVRKALEAKYAAEAKSAE